MPSTHRHGDPADVFHIRSTDSGRDLQRAIQVEYRHGDYQAQWQPNLSVSDRWHPLRHVV